MTKINELTMLFKAANQFMPPQICQGLRLALVTGFLPVFINLMMSASQGFATTPDSVQWASGLRYQYNSMVAGDYSGYQALGKPDAFPPGNLNPNAFRLKSDRNFGTLIVGFDKPQAINQIFIVENHLPGRISKIKLLDVSGGIHVVYHQKPEAIPDFFRTLVLNLQRTSYRVEAIEININTIHAPGYSQIDAIGIADAINEKLAHEVFAGANFNLKTVLPFTSEKILIDTTSYRSFKRDHGWDTPRYLRVNGTPIDPTTGDYFLSTDHHVLIMAANKPGGFGAQDLYVCEKDENGNFGKVVNLGAVINTKEADFSPFLTRDMNTLFFSSGGA